MNVLGLNAWHGDASAALIRDGEVVAAIAEERINRIKHAAGFPRLAIREVMRIGGIGPDQLDLIAVGRNNRAHLLLKALHLVRHRPSPAAVLPRLRARRRLSALRTSVAEALDIPAIALRSVPVEYVEHHRAHATAAFFGSGFTEAAIMTVDGFGDFVSTTTGLGNGRRVRIDDRVFYPHSIGIVYQAVTQFIGFVHYGDEGKTMGLSPYGEPEFVDDLRRMIHLRPDGSFRLDARWFSHVRGGVATSWEGAIPDIPPLFTDAWVGRFGPPREPGSEITSRERNLAHSVQVVLEEFLFARLNELARRTGQARVCLAGGVALNCVANGKIGQRTPFRENFIFPAAGDDGLAIGAAWDAMIRHGGPKPAPVAVPLWGPRYPDTADRVDLTVAQADPAIVIERLEESELFSRAAETLARGGILGWYRGREEFGPRALGCRSILADPRQPDMKDRLNRRIKHREPFRPFAPAILREAVDDWFLDAQPSPAMLHAFHFRPERAAQVPAVCHVDGSGRVQTVERDEHPEFWRLLQAFAERTGVPILLNTSFNENEPIVHTPQQALDCFLRTDMDALVLETLWLERRR